MVGPPPSSWAVDPGAGQAFELAEGLWSLRLPLPWNDVPWVNAYAVARDDGIMLVDCGGAGDPSAIELIGIPVTDVDPKQTSLVETL